VIRIPIWTNGCEALSLSHDPRTGTTRAFMHWITDKGHMELLDFLRHQKDPSAFEHPLLLPSWLLRYHRKSAETYRGELDKSILKIEHQIGYALPGLLYHKPSNSQPRSGASEGYSFEDIIRRLHAILTELGSLALEANFGKDCGTFLLETEQKLRNRKNSGVQYILSKISEGLSDHINFNTSLYSTMSAQVAVLKDRVQSHINLVGQSLNGVTKLFLISLPDIQSHCTRGKQTQSRSGYKQ
jgi:hypothetical protein